MQITDLLSALCYVSPEEGRQLVLGGISESQRQFNESYRFEWLVRSLIPVADEDDESGVWEWRTACLALLNALTTSPEDVQERCELRGELQRRGIADVLDVSQQSAVD